MAKCKKIVSHFRLGLLRRQCKRNAIKDGFFKQHHPDEVKKRELHSEKKLAATSFNMFHKY